MPADKTRVLKNVINNKQQFELNLADQEIAGAIISIAAYLIIVASSYQDKIKILNPMAKINPARTAANGSLLVLFGSLILTYVAFLRLEQREEEVERGTSSSSLIANIEIVNGYAISLIGNIFKLMGAVQRAEEAEGQITIM